MEFENVLLSLRDVTLIRGLRVLIQNVSFNICTGEIWTLEGENGVGKTSLVRTAAGLFRPFSGHVQRRPSMGLSYLGHELGLKPDWTPRQILSFDQLDRWALWDLVDLPIQHLSYGQKKRVALARRCDPLAKLWLFDEPMANLDSRQRDRVEQALQQHASNGGGALCSFHGKSLGHHRLLIQDGTVRHV